MLFKRHSSLLQSCLVLAICLAGLLMWPAHAQSGVVFDDSAPDSMRMSNDYYELTLSKTNGAVLSLVDKHAGANLAQGSRGGCLWGAVFPGHSPDYVGGCRFSDTGANRFSYTWDIALSTLTLTFAWQAGVSPSVNATVVMTAGTDAFFDLRQTLENHWGATLQNVLLPSDLVFADASVQAGYGPFLMPGVRLRPGFFTQGHTFVPTYPSDAAFADYLAADLNGGWLALYTVNPSPNPIQPVALGFVDDDAANPQSFYIYHSFYTWVTDGQTWTSPIVRVRIGQSAEQTMLAYRQENGIAAYPSLALKLGTKLDTLSRAPLIKADAWKINKPFRQWIPDLDRLPRPSLLHPVAFQPRGHDENYPDFLPPDARWGTTADFRAMVTAAQSRGLLVMPYINPTWWDDESPTIRSLAPLTIPDIAMLDTAHQPVYETYGGKGGYVVSPQASFVGRRLSQLLAQWQSEVPVDCIFEDQIGARAWRRDFNASAPNPQTYSDGWLAHTRTYTTQCLMTEMGWDRLAETEVGFHGSLLTWAREFDYANQNWGSGNWEPYPLAVWLFHDKVLLYQHDLSQHTMSQDMGVLTWNLAFGNMLSYDWQWAENDPLGNPWLDLVATLQRTVAARSAGRMLTRYTELAADVTQSRFDDLAVIANWHPTLTYRVDGHQIAPGGFLARTDDGSILAGVFTGFFNDNGLAPGEHYILVERTPHVVMVRQPVGPDTALSVAAPEAWQPGETLHVWAHDGQGNPLGEVSFWMDGRQVYFVYHQKWNGQVVGHYALVKSIKTYLPLIVHGY